MKIVGVVLFGISQKELVKMETFTWQKKENLVDILVSALTTLEF